MHATVCILPMKDPARAKSRLSIAIEPEERSKLAIKLFKKTITNLLKSNLKLDLVVVTGSEVVLDICKQFGVKTIEEPKNSDLNKILEEACQWANGKHYKQAIIIPSDLANPNFLLLNKFMNFHSEENIKKITIFPSYDGGTNCLITSLPILYPLQYGKGSALKHIEKAMSFGYQSELLDIEEFRLDIDTIEDLQLMEK